MVFSWSDYSLVTDNPTWPGPNPWDSDPAWELDPVNYFSPFIIVAPKALKSPLSPRISLLRLSSLRVHCLIMVTWLPYVQFALKSCDQSASKQKYIKQNYRNLVLFRNLRTFDCPWPCKMPLRNVLTVIEIWIRRVHAIEHFSSEIFLCFKIIAIGHKIILIGQKCPINMILCPIAMIFKQKKMSLTRKMSYCMNPSFIHISMT